MSALLGIMSDPVAVETPAVVVEVAQLIETALQFFRPVALPLDRGHGVAFAYPPARDAPPASGRGVVALPAVCA